MFTTIRPLRDYLAVRPLPDAQAGLVFVVREGRPRRGEVLAVGPGKRVKGRYRPWGTRVGDVIQFTDVCNYPKCTVNGEELLILQEADVCGIEVEAPQVAA